MYLPQVRFEGMNDRKAHLANILLGTNTITKISLGSYRMNNLEKISLDLDKNATLQAYRELRNKCDEKAYSVKWLDAIGEKITDFISPALRPLIKGVKAVLPAGESAAESAGKVVTEIAEKTAGDLSSINRKYKIAKISNSDFNQILFIETEILKLAKNNGIYAETLEELSYKLNYINKQAGAGEVAGKGLSMVGRGLKGVGKGLGTATLKSLPFVGIATDLTLMCKNLYEAWINGKKIIEELPLEKYNISTADALIPTPSNTTKLSSQLTQLGSDYKDSPSDLSEILSISQTLMAYATDFVSTLTNLAMSLIDILDFVPGVGFLVSLILSIPFIAIEMGNDTLVEESYGKSIGNIKLICDEKIASLSNDSSEISSEQKDFMRSFLQSSSEPQSRGEILGSVIKEEGLDSSSPTPTVRAASIRRLYNSLSLK